MSTQTIELEGFEIELASELYCDRGGDHRELVDRARTDRRRLGHNVDESAVAEVSELVPEVKLSSAWPSS